MSIVSDKPFEIGDYILINGIEGNVKKIGIKSVRIERNTGEEVVIPNSKITGSELHNFKVLNKRRFDLTINVVLSTPHDKLQAIPQIAESICKDNPLLQFVICSLNDITNSASYQFTTIVYVLDKTGAVMLREKEQFIYKFTQALSKNGITFPVPTMVVKQ